MNADRAQLRMYGGPRPQNSLSHKGPQISPHSSSIASRKSKSAFQNELKTEVRRGDNVKVMPHATASEDGYGMNMSKRRKLVHSSDPPTSNASSEEVLDKLDPRLVSFGPSQHASRRPSVHSQDTMHSLRRSGSSTGSLTEHNNVERMMKSGSATKKRPRRTNGQSHQNSSEPDIQPIIVSTASQPIIIPGDDDHPMDMEFEIASPRLPYQGTARVQNPMTTPLKTFKSESSGLPIIKSCFFTKEQPVSTQSHGSPKLGTVKAHAQKSTQEFSESLNSKFISLDGRRRGSGASFSSDRDELDQTGNTVRNLVDPISLSPTKQSRKTNAAKRSTPLTKPLSYTEDQISLEPSTIKPSTFRTTKPKCTQSGRHTKSRSPSEEAKPPLDFELAAICIGSDLKKSHNIGIVYDATSKTYGAQENGKWVGTGTSSLRIDPEKLISIDWGTSGGKVRFTSSKVIDEDHILDLQFRKEKDLAELVKNLSGGQGLKVNTWERYVICTTRDRVHKLTAFCSLRMDKIFDKRREEFRQQYNGGRSTLVLREVHHPTVNERAQESQYIRPQRKSGSLVDDLCNRASGGNRMDYMKHDDRPTSTCTRGAVLASRPLLIPLDHNSHLRRSKRMSGPTSKSLQDPFDKYADIANGFHDDEPEYEKYSKIHGLGQKWRKPLTYPRTGKKKVTIEWSDLERLDEGEFLNDNLIGFYLRFLEQTFEEKRPNLANKVYFFNTYFYATLMNAHKPKRSFNYKGVQKWTKSVDIFTYDYIVVPINENSHWYLAIICNLPQLDRVVMPEEASSSQTRIESPGMAEEHNESAIPLSSPGGNLRPTKITRLGQDEQGPEEKEARNSFAELNLGNDHTDFRNADHLPVAGASDIATKKAFHQVNGEMPELSINESMQTIRGSSVTPYPEQDTHGTQRDILHDLEEQINRELPSEVPDSQPSYPQVMVADRALHGNATFDKELFGGAQVEDQEMLDSQLDAQSPDLMITEVGNRPAVEILERPIEPVDDPIEDPGKSINAHARTKKQKRKSIPPIAFTDPTTPAIITFDSLGQTRSATTKILKQYLMEEATSKRGMEVDTSQIKGINAKVPQQMNFSDCGLFLLGYVSKFLERDPKDFIAKIISRQYTSAEDWSKLNPSNMRADIRTQVQGLHKAQVDEEREKAKKSGKFKDETKTSSPAPIKADVPKTDAQHVIDIDD